MSANIETVIRPLRAEDYAAWLPLWRGYQAFYEVEIPAAVSELTWRRLIDPAETVGGALAWQGADAVGLVHHIQHRSCWTEGDYCYLQDLFVSPSVRGGGVGRKLIEHVYETAARNQCSRVYWLTHETNTKAMLLYDRIAERSGFVQYRHKLSTGAMPRA
ncbi:GNAT family N-acetyltransferase [Pandoraea terrae]|uniref:GNAT family N-acetyltransferase n=1 Tax=Pandoraea terrae TaxID=1537710 RepID=A0A5E4Y034_9BURK|nr:GNAT family N-acetyltransferase [Pandoraea terrae]VVE41986.1 GNAT family N-acetyltransferase [Pandoraea terrae]